MPNQISLRLLAERTRERGSFPTVGGCFGTASWKVRNGDDPVAVPAAALVGLNFIKENWAALALVALVCGAYVKGCSDERERFDDFKEQLEATSKRQKEWRDARIATQQRITTESNEAFKAELKGLRTRNADLANQLRKRASADIVPTSPNAPSGDPGGGEICYDRARLAGGVRDAVDRFLGRSLTSVSGGSEKIAALVACVKSWEKQVEAAKLQSQP